MPYAYRICILSFTLIFTNCRVSLRRGNPLLLPSSVWWSVFSEKYLSKCFPGLLPTLLWSSFHRSTVFRLLKVFLVLTEPENRLSLLRKPKIWSHPQPLQCNSDLHNILFNIHLNAILPSTPRIPKGFLPLRLSNRKLFSTPKLHTFFINVATISVLDEW
jgi:hypothetical protein